MIRFGKCMFCVFSFGFAVFVFASEAPVGAPAAPALPPGLALPPGGSMMQPGKAMPFPAPGAMGVTNINPEVLRKAMQARSELDDLTRKMQARQAHLYESNTRIQELQGKMRQTQQEIDDILAKDDELAALRAKLDGMFNAPMPMPVGMPSAPQKEGQGHATPAKETGKKTTAGN